MSSKKKSIQAKIVMHAHRRRFQEYVRTKGRDKMSIGYVYWAMFHRSGKGNVFELEEGLFLADLGITHPTLSGARKVLVGDGWLSKAAQKIDPLTGKWGTTAWTVNIEAVVNSVDDGTDVNSTGDGSTVNGSADSGSVDDTVVLHLQYAETPSASTSPVPPSEGTSPVLKEEGKEEGTSEPAAPPIAAFGGCDEDDPSTPDWVELPDFEAEAQIMFGAIFPVRKPEGLDYAETRDTLNKIAEENVGIPWKDFFVWVNTHQPDKYHYGSITQFAKSMATGHALNKFWNHDAKKDGCKICFNLGLNLSPETSPKSNRPPLCQNCGWEKDSPRCKCAAKAPCSRCKGSTYGRPTIEDGRTLCPDCMKLPHYRRQSGKRDILGKGDDLSIDPVAKAAKASGFDVTEAD